MAIARAEFGRTGHHSTRVIFGGASLAAVSQRVADETLDVLLSYGYEPLHEPNDIDLAVWWALSRQGVFLDSVGDVGLLPAVLDAASRFAGPPDAAAMTGLVRLSAAEPLFV